jgi:hypothetical protein
MSSCKTIYNNLVDDQIAQHVVCIGVDGVSTFKGLDLMLSF